MEEELILQQPADRRLGNMSASLPPGPPGAESDAAEFETKKAPKLTEKESSSAGKSSRRRSPSGSPPPKRKSPMRSRRSPSPRRRRSPSTRRNRYRDYSPERRGRGMRRSPDRRRTRSPRDRDRRGGGRDRYRGGRGNSRSRSRSISPRRGGRWSPKKKPMSPIAPTMGGAPPPPSALGMGQPAPGTGQGPAQYGVMPPQMYGETYGSSAAYNQYGVPPPTQQSFAQTADTYGMAAGGAPTFNAAFPPPSAWGVNDAYAQQAWMQQPVPDPNQMQQIPQTPTSAVATQLAPPASSSTSQSMSTLSDAAPGTVDPNPTHDAVAQEAENQRDELKKQRSSYLKKTAILKKELKMLKEQRRDLHAGGAPPSPTTKGFIDENEKLQNQIDKKLVTIENVIDMLTGIIGEENLDKETDDTTSDTDAPPTVGKEREVVSRTSAERVQKKKRSTTESSSDTSSTTSSSTSSSTSSENEEEEDDDSSPERLKNKAIESMKSKQKEALKKETTLKVKEERIVEEKKRFNYVFYDPEMHWCQTCDVFPKTAKDFLNHLHSKEHASHENIDTPWHSDMVHDQYPTYENAPVKRTPIRGLTFFVPATAWYCKLCSIWMGDLHCASTHLKSQLHSNKYNTFLETNQNFEVNWLADRQRVLNEKKPVILPPQITSVSTTAAEQSHKKSKKEEEKVKKRKKKQEKKERKKKKKKQRGKKRKRNVSTSTSSSSASSSSEDVEPKKKRSPIAVKELDNPNPAASIRVTMRKQEPAKVEDIDEPPPPPPVIKPQGEAGTSGRLSRWTVAHEGTKVAIESNVNQTAYAKSNEEDVKRDDAILQQWNNVQPVISESEKKLLEQLKGKLKNKPKEDLAMSGSVNTARSTTDATERDREHDRRETTRRRVDETDRRHRSRSPAYGGGGRSRSRDRRSHSRNRGRRSPLRWGGRRRRSGSRFRRRSRSIDRRRRNSRSRSRSMRRRSRSLDRRRRLSRSRTRSRTRSRSPSRGRIEKAIVKHSEFRPRVPEKEKDRDKKSTDNKDKKDSSTANKKSKSSTSTSASTNSGKKLPFIGKMPVFKKQNSGQVENGDKRAEDGGNYGTEIGAANVGAVAAVPYNAAGLLPPAPRPPAPTAAQIQMAMMEDAYGNAPPFHPDAGMIVDYDDLMPDPVQFVNLMGQAPPPPPPTNQEAPTSAADDSEDDVLPPGIDEMESEQFAPKPLSEATGKGNLPKDLEEALNIIFPGEKKESEGEQAEAELQKLKAKGETQIIIEEPVMQVEDLVKEGIHMVTIEETSMAAMDEASQLSMNEPLIFNKPHAGLPAAPVMPVPSPVPLPPTLEDTSQNAADIDLHKISSPISVPDGKNGHTATKTDIKLLDIATPVDMPDTADIPMPASNNNNSATDAQKLVFDAVYDLDDIPHPPPSPTESEKHRRQEELDDLAMLGIDADDMAAQCI